MFQCHNAILDLQRTPYQVFYLTSVDFLLLLQHPYQPIGSSIVQLQKQGRVFFN